MRRFLVLGFTGHSKDELGENLYFGSDRDAAIAIMKTPGEGFARTEFREIGTYDLRREFND